MRRGCFCWFAKRTALLCFHISQVLYWEAIYKQVQLSQMQPSVLVLSWPATVFVDSLGPTDIYQSCTRFATYHKFVHTCKHVLYSSLRIYRKYSLNSKLLSLYLIRIPILDNNNNNKHFYLLISCRAVLFFLHIGQCQTLLFAPESAYHDCVGERNKNQGQNKAASSKLFM